MLSSIQCGNRFAVLLAAILTLLVGVAVGSAAPHPNPSGSGVSIYLPAITRIAAWLEVGVNSATGGGISNNSSGSVYPSAAVSPNGTPYIAWHDTDLTELAPENEIYVRYWNGTSWAEVGPGSAAGDGISNTAVDSRHPSLAIGPDNTPYIAWVDGHEIYVRRWSGNSWEEVGVGSASGGGISNTTGVSEEPSMAVAPDGTPYITWRDNEEGSYPEIYVRRWNGASWEEVGAGSAGGGGISNNIGVSSTPSIAIDLDGTPSIAWTDNSYWNMEIYIRRWNGSTWEEVGAGSATLGISNTSGDSFAPSLAISPDGQLYIAWHEHMGLEGYEVYVRRWNGSNWEEAGPGSASSGGISNLNGYSVGASIAITPDGTPYVAWRDDNSGNWEIYARYWNGSFWQAVGGASASGGGISNSSGGTIGRPSLATGSNGLPYIAWDDLTIGNYEIYVRRLQ